MSYRDVVNLLAEHGVAMTASTVYRWVQKFGPEVAKRAFAHKTWRGLDLFVGETYIRVRAAGAICGGL